MLKERRSTGDAARDLAVGAVSGYFGSRVMDRATGWYFGRQGEASRRREEELAPGGAPVLAGRKLAGVIGREVTDDGAARIGAFVHRSLGMAYGVAASASVRTGMPPVRAGLLAGTAAFFLVDEGLVGTVFTPRRGLIRWRATCGGWSGTSRTGSPPGACSLLPAGLGH